MEISITGIRIVLRQKHGEIVSSIHPGDILTGLEQDSLLRLLDTGAAASMVMARAHLRGALTRPLEAMGRLMENRGPKERVTVNFTVGARHLYISQGHSWIQGTWTPDAPKCCCGAMDPHHGREAAWNATIGGDGLDNHTEIRKWCGSDRYSITAYDDGGPVAWGTGTDHPDGLVEPDVWGALETLAPTPHYPQCLYCGKRVRENPMDGGTLYPIHGDGSWVCPMNPGTETGDRDTDGESRLHITEMPLAHEVTGRQAAAILRQQARMDVVVECILCPQEPDAFPHEHYRVCPDCGDMHRSVLAIPDRVTGGGLVSGCTVQVCSRCDRRLRFIPRSLPTVRYGGPGVDF